MISKEEVIRRMLLSIATGKMVEGVKVIGVKEQPTKAQLKRKDLKELWAYMDYNNYSENEKLKPEWEGGKSYYDTYNYYGPKASMKQIMESYAEYRS